MSIENIFESDTQPIQAEDVLRPEAVEIAEPEQDEMDLLTERLIELNELSARGEDVEEEHKAVFKELVSATYENIFSLTVGRLKGDRDAASEAVQETYLRAWKHREKFRGDARFSTWVHRIAINTAHNFSVKKGKSPKASLDEEHMEKHLEDPSSEDSFEGVEAKLSFPVQKLLDKLSHGNRDAIILTVIMDMPDKKAGELLGIEIGRAHV